MLINSGSCLFAYEFATRQLSNLSPKIGESISLNLLFSDTAVVTIKEKSKELTGEQKQQVVQGGGTNKNTTWIVDLRDFSKTEANHLSGFYAQQALGEFVLIEESLENRVKKYEIYDKKVRLIREMLFVGGEKVYQKPTLEGAALLVWTNSILTCFLKDQPAKLFNLGFKETDDAIEAQISTDLIHIAAFCGSSGELKVFNTSDSSLRIYAQGFENEKRFYGYRQYFHFDEINRTLYFLHGDDAQAVNIYCLEKYIHKVSISIPSGLKCNQFWLSQDLSALYFGGAQVECFHPSSIPPYHAYTTVVLKIPLRLNTDCQWGGTKLSLLDMVEPKLRSSEEIATIGRMMSLWSALPKQVLINNPIFSWIVYCSHNAKLLSRYQTRILDTSEPVLNHNLLDFFFLQDLSVDERNLILSGFKESFRVGSFPYYLQKRVKTYFLDYKDKLLANNLTRDMASFLLIAPTSVKIRAELKSKEHSMISFIRHPSTQLDETVVESLLEDNPNSLEDYRVHETRLKLELGNGADFSCVLFELIDLLPNDKVKTVFKPIIYYKWKLLFWWALMYFVLVWTNNILAYLYLGYLMDVRTLGILNIITGRLLIIFEFRTAVSNVRVYKSSWWKIYDLAIYSFNIVAVVYNISSSEDDRNMSITNIWLRFLPVTLLGARSLTWLRVFGPTRYMITMVMEVFAEIAAFLIILSTILLVYAYSWRLAGGLHSGLQEIPTSFYISVINAINLIFGNSPNPLGETGTPFDLLMFIVYILGNITLGLVMLNFLIALISGTSERVSSDRELYDLKELLPLIRDFDLFLKRSKLRKIIAKKERGDLLRNKSFFALLIREADVSDDTRELKNAIDNSLQMMTSNLNSELMNLQKWQRCQLEELKSGFT
jgi:hypothetical protein